MNLENALVRYIGYGQNVNLVNRDRILYDGNFINAIVGPRRSGKTSLMLLHMKNLNVDDNNKVFLNCEDIDFVGITTNDLDDLEKTIYRVYKPSQSQNIYLFIDEVQSFPDWARWLRTLFDQHKYKIFVTGSTSELCLGNLPSELRGRAVNTMVLPFSFNEFLRVKGIVTSEFMRADEVSRAIAALSEFLDYGGYPEIVKVENSFLKRMLLSELYATVIQRDLIEKYGIRKTAVFRAFVNSLFGSVCRNLSIPSLVNWFDTQGTKVSIQTATNYVNYAQSAFLFFLIYPYSRKIKERNTKPKLYVSDSGILGLLDSDVGKKLENAVFVELTRRGENVYYYKTASEDVDFLLTKENHVSELIQVCYSINEPLTYARETKSLLNAGQKLKCNNLTIVTFNEEKAIKLNENLVTVVPAWKWLRL